MDLPVQPCGCSIHTGVDDPRAMGTLHYSLRSYTRFIQGHAPGVTVRYLQRQPPRHSHALARAWQSHKAADGIGLESSADVDMLEFSSRLGTLRYTAKDRLYQAILANAN